MTFVGQLYSLRGTVRMARFRLRHHRPSLDRAIRHLERSAARLDPAHPDRALVLSALSNGLLWRYELTSDAADLDAAVDRLREGIASPGASAVDRSTARGDLAAVLRVRFVLSGDVGDLDEAIDAATDAIRHGEEVDSAITNRARALLARYEHTARFADLLAALRDARTPVRGAVAGALHRGLRLGVLIDALAARYRHTADPEDLAAAIAAGREALATLSRVDPNRAGYASALSVVLRLDPARLSEAVDAAEEAVRATPREHADHAGRLSELSMALFMRAGPGDRDRARALADEALAATTGSNRPMLQQRVALLARATDDPAARAAGVRAVRDALEVTPPGHPLHDALVCELVDLQAPGASTELLVAAVRRPGPALSLRSALRAASRLAELGDAGHSLLGYRRAVDLLPTAAWPGLRRPVREARLQEAPPATDAAARALGTGDRRLAVELLDAGRSVLWSQQLDLRTDLTRLRRAAPATADRLTEISVRLDSAVTDV